MMSKIWYVLKRVSARGMICIKLKFYIVTISHVLINITKENQMVSLNTI